MRLAAVIFLCVVSASALPLKANRVRIGTRAGPFRSQNTCLNDCSIPSQCSNPITTPDASSCSDLSVFYSGTISALQGAHLPASCTALAGQLLCPALYGASDYYANAINCDVSKAKQVPIRLCQSACESAVQQLLQCAQTAGASEFKASAANTMLSCDAANVHTSDCMSAEGRYVPPADDSNDEFMSTSSTTGVVLGVALCMLLIGAGIVVCYNRYKGRPLFYREGSAALPLQQRHQHHTEAEVPEPIGGGTYMNGHTGTAIVFNEEDAFRERPPLPPGPPPEHVVERTQAREREDASLLNS